MALRMLEFSFDAPFWLPMFHSFSQRDPRAWVVEEVLELLLRRSGVSTRGQARYGSLKTRSTSISIAGPIPKT
jgi:hypothetical protein